jgi:hypothetical protein
LSFLSFFEPFEPEAASCEPFVPSISVYMYNISILLRPFISHIIYNNGFAFSRKKNSSQKNNGAMVVVASDNFFLVKKTIFKILNEKVFSQ